MKKIIGLVVMFVCAASLFALDFTVGVKGNIGLADTISSEESYMCETTPRFAYAFGVAADISVMDAVSVQPEVWYRMGNGLQDVEESGTINWTFNTIDIPVLVKYSIPLAGGKLGCMAGPSFSFVVGKFVTQDSDGKEEFDPKELEMNTFLIGCVVGVEYDYPVGPGFVTVGGRLNYDFTKYGENSSGLMGDYSRISYGVDIGYAMKF